MKKVITMTGAILLIIIGFLSFLKQIRDPPCKVGNNKKHCIDIVKFKDSPTDYDTKYMKKYRNMHIVRIIVTLLMLINGILFFVIKK